MRFALRRRLFLAGAGLMLLLLVPAYAVSSLKVWRQTAMRSTWTADDRRLSGAEGAQLDPELFRLARRTIPRDATYAVIAGTERGVSQLAASAAASFAQYSLLPRRQAATAADAEWVIALGVPLELTRLRFERVVRFAGQAEIGKVRR